MAMPLHRCIPQWDLHIGDWSIKGYVLAVGASHHQGFLLSPKESHSGILLMAANSLYVHGGGSMNAYCTGDCRVLDTGSNILNIN